MGVKSRQKVLKVQITLIEIFDDVVIAKTQSGRYRIFNLQTENLNILNQYEIFGKKIIRTAVFKGKEGLIDPIQKK